MVLREEAPKMKTLALHTHTLVTHSSRKDKRLRRRERSFEQGVKRFSCLIQPPRKLSKTKDPSRDYCTHVLSMLWELKMKLFLKISQFLLHFLPHSLSLSILFPSNRHSRLIFCSPADQMKTRNTELFIWVISQPRLCFANLSTYWHSSQFWTL